ncbi:MAG: helix-turn-helix domain-containing protein [Bacteroidaceae bacterium]|nr:helix-turn-helix domain-containing protein [Bacteroidaceae bacterium]
MNNLYLKKISQQGFATIKSSLQQFVQHSYQFQFTSIFWCLSGEALFTIDGQKHRFTVGQIIICPRGSNILLLDITSDFSARLLGLSKQIWLAARSSFTPETMHSIERCPHKGGSTEIEQEFISNIFRQIDIIEFLAATQTDCADFCRSNIVLSVNAILLYIHKLKQNKESQGRDIIAENKDKLFNDFKMLLTQKFRDERSVQYYADNMKISTRHLNAICQRASGQNAKEIIDQYTIIELQVVLLYTHKTFQELVKDFNFPDQSYLNRYFKRHTGYSLSEFRSKGVMVDD